MNLADLLFGAYRRDVLGLLLLHPGEAYHVRELARMTGKPANTLYRELLTLAKAGLLLRAPQGNQVVYRANQDCPIYEELRGIFKKTTGLAEVLREALAPLRERVKAAFVYGSVASGEENARSDVDVMIVGEIKFEDAIYALAPAEKTLRREINPHVFPPNEYHTKLSERGGFLERVLNGPKILLIGDADDLGKPARNRKAKAT